MSDLYLYEVHCGGRIGTEDHFFVAAKDIGEAMGPVFARFNAKTIDDLPKPFNLVAVEADLLTMTKEVKALLRQGRKR